MKERHGLSGHKLHPIWMAILWRCHGNPSEHVAKRYRDRGITVCEEWRNGFLSFYNWSMSNGWSEGLQIDRIDNDGPYSPNNCRWVSYQVNMANRSNTLFIEYEGIIQPVTLILHSKGIDYRHRTLAYKRLKLGWTLDDAISKPTRKKS